MLGCMLRHPPLRRGRPGFMMNGWTFNSTGPFPSSGPAFRRRMRSLAPYLGRSRANMSVSATTNGRAAGMCCRVLLRLMVCS